MHAVTQVVTDNDIIGELDRQIHVLLPDFEGEILPERTFLELAIDSLTTVDLLATMEMTYGIEVPDDELAKVVKVQDLIDLVQKLRSQV